MNESHCGNPGAIVPDPTRTAYHEAGHAVVAAYLNRAVESVELHDDHTGSTRLPSPCGGQPGPVDPIYQQDEVACTVAGYVAERIKMGNNEPGSERQSSICRMQMPWQGVRDYWLTSEKATAKVEVEEARARYILESHWSSVEKVAQELLRHKRLEGEALAAILDVVRSEAAGASAGSVVPEDCQ